MASQRDIELEKEREKISNVFLSRGILFPSASFVVGPSRSSLSFSLFFSNLFSFFKLRLFYIRREKKPGKQGPDSEERFIGTSERNKQTFCANRTGGERRGVRSAQRRSKKRKTKPGLFPSSSLAQPCHQFLFLNGKAKGKLLLERRE